MRALAALALTLFAPACASLPFIGDEESASARIADSTSVDLPLPPNYPETRTVSQIVRGRYGAAQGAFESLVTLSPDRVEIVVTAPSGPRLATILWTEKGIEENRTLLAPMGVPVENILADLFVSYWPRDAVAAALPRDVELREAADGGRTLVRAGAPIMQIQPDADDPARTTLRNLAYGYELSIVSRDVE